MKNKIFFFKGAIILLGISFFVFQVSMTIVKTSKNFLYISKHNVEERRRITYSGYGYSYISFVHGMFPEKSLFPSTRYTDYSKNIHVLFPQKIDFIIDHVLIAVDADDSNFTTRKIASLERIDGTNNQWTFSTIDDYDSLDEMRIIVDSCISGNAVVGILLFKFVDDKNPYLSMNQSVKCEDGESAVVNVPHAGRPFSLRRGKTPFKAVIDASGAIVRSADAYGTKIDVSGYDLIHTHEANHTYIDRKWRMNLDPASPADASWIAFIKRLSDG